MRVPEKPSAHGSRRHELTHAHGPSLRTAPQSMAAAWSAPLGTGLTRAAAHLTSPHGHFNGTFDTFEMKPLIPSQSLRSPDVRPRKGHQLPPCRCSWNGGNQSQVFPPRVVTVTLSQSPRAPSLTWLCGHRLLSTLPSKLASLVCPGIGMTAKFLSFSFVQ